MENTIYLNIELQFNRCREVNLLLGSHSFPVFSTGVEIYSLFPVQFWVYGSFS